MAKLIHVLPLSVKTEELLHMEQTELRPECRSIASVIDMIDSRYGRTDSERACDWLTPPTVVKRETHVGITKIPGMATNDKVVFIRSIRAMRLPDGQLLVVLSDLGSRPGRLSVGALREITIRMYETRKPGGDSAEVSNSTIYTGGDAQAAYHATDNYWGESDWSWGEEEWCVSHDEDVSEVLLGDGSIMLTKPKKAHEATKYSWGPRIASSMSGGELQSRSESEREGFWEIGAFEVWRFCTSLEGLPASIPRKAGPAIPLERKGGGPLTRTKQSLGRVPDSLPPFPQEQLMAGAKWEREKRPFHRVGNRPPPNLFLKRQ